MKRNLMIYKLNKLHKVNVVFLKKKDRNWHSNNNFNLHLKEHVEIMQNTLHKYYDDPHMEYQ